MKLGVLESLKHGLSRRTGLILFGVVSALVPVAGPAIASSSAPKVSIVSLAPGQIKVHDRGEFAIGLVCQNATGPCAGLVTVRLSGRTGAAVASARVRLRGRRMTLLTLALSRPARKMLAFSHHLNVVLTVQVRDRARREARLTVRRGLVPGAPVGCWPRGEGYNADNWASGRLFSYVSGSTGNPRTFGCLYRLDHAYPLDDPGGGLTTSRWPVQPYSPIRS